MIDELSLAKDLIAKPSITPHDAHCQSLIASILSELSFKCEHMRFENVDNLWARIGDQEPLFVFAGHTDVVPPGPLNDWTHDPFEPTVQNGFLFGRGASDMKAALACMIVATKNFLQKRTTLKGSLGFLITSDEEGSAKHGTKRVIETLQSRNEKISYCLIGEPSSISTVGDQIRIGRRGSLHGKLVVHGKQGHVAHPHLAKNPIHMVAIALHEIAQMEWDKGNLHFPPTSFQFTNIHSGTGATNVIPGHLETLFNFRFSTAITLDEIKKRTEELLHKHGLHFDLAWEVGGHPFLTEQSNLIFSTQIAIKEVTGVEVKLSTGGGTSDGRFIAPTGAQVVELGLSHATAHHVDEHIRVDDLPILSATYEKILSLLL